MTLSPVFLGTIRSRLMVGLMPLFSFIIVTIFEFIGGSGSDSEYGKISRAFFYPPVSSGIILLYSVLYIDVLLPLIIWTPPQSLFVPKSRRVPTYIGNRAAMLLDFNKLLPKKTSNHALMMDSLIFFFSCCGIMMSAVFYYYHTENDAANFLDDNISKQQLKLSPFISIYYCLFFTSFTTGALLVANKLPLGQVWGHDVPIGIKLKKILVFVLIQALCIMITFILPTISNTLSQVILGFDERWISQEFYVLVFIAFGFGILVSVGWILEQVLFVRVG